jgi:PIN domain nuclease of toxin-antitoxin system
MKFLPDSHLLLWAVSEPTRISSEAHAYIENLGNELFFSAASLWEIAIKTGMGRADFQVDVQLLRRTLLQNRYEELPVTSEHVIALRNLPPIHKDPFDRMLIAQATVEGITLLTTDEQVARYPGPIRKA